MQERRFLVRWIGGSAAATLFGLGIGGFVGLMGLHEGEIGTFVPSTLVFSAAVAGTVGLVQGTILAERLAGLTPTKWASRTGTGAIVAWIVIAYPVRMLTAADAVRPSWLNLVLVAAGVGLAVGVLVSIAQWFELRKYVAGALWSVPLLGGAWMAGAVVFFVANRLVEEFGLLDGVGSELVAVSVAAAVLLMTGGFVAAIQGLGLIRVLGVRQPPGRANSRISPAVL